MESPINNHELQLDYKARYDSLQRDHAALIATHQSSMVAANNMIASLQQQIMTITSERDTALLEASIPPSGSVDGSSERKQKQQKRARVVTDDIKASATTVPASHTGVPAIGAPPSSSVSYAAFVDGVPFHAEEHALRDFFASCGNITKVDLPVHRDTRKPKGIAFVTFDSKEGLDRAIAMDGEAMMHRYLAIKEAEIGYGGYGMSASMTAPAAPVIPLSIKPIGCKSVFVGNLSWYDTYI